MRHQLIDNYYQSPEYLSRLRKKIDVLKKMETDQYYRAERLLDVYSVDPIAFIEDFCLIKLTEFGGQPKPMFLFPYQKKIILELQERENSNLDIDLLIDKPRGMGLTWLMCSYMLWRWLFQPNWTAFVLSRTESEVDDGTSTPDSSIFGKIRWQMSYLPKYMFPEEFKPKQTRGTTTDSSLRIINPQTGAAIVGSSTNSNAGRSRRYSFIFIDECFYIENFNSVYRSLNSVARMKVFVSTTVESKSAKDFKEMCEERGHYIPLTWRDHPFKDEQWYQDLLEKAEQLDDPDLMREAEVNYSVSPKSQYYPQITESKILAVEYDRNKPLYVSMDIGRQDLTVFCYWQFNGQNLILLEAYENKNKPLEWYVPFLNPDLNYNPDFYNQFQQEFLQKIRRWRKPNGYFGEHDHFVKKMPNNTSSAQVLAPFGIHLRYNSYAINHPPRHAATTQMLPRTIFNQSSDAVMRVYDAIANSKYANMVKTTTENLKPIHGDDGTADRRAAVENMMVNVGRVLKAQREDVAHPDDRSFAAAIVKQLRV